MEEDDGSGSVEQSTEYAFPANASPQAFCRQRLTFWTLRLINGCIGPAPLLIELGPLTELPRIVAGQQQINCICGASFVYCPHDGFLT